jgi:hypothetical protein
MKGQITQESRSDDAIVQKIREVLEWLRELEKTSPYRLTKTDSGEWFFENTDGGEPILRRKLERIEEL